MLYSLQCQLISAGLLYRDDWYASSSSISRRLLPTKSVAFQAWNTKCLVYNKRGGGWHLQNGFTYWLHDSANDLATSLSWYRSLGDLLLNLQFWTLDLAVLEKPAAVNSIRRHFCATFCSYVAICLVSCRLCNSCDANLLTVWSLVIFEMLSCFFSQLMCTIAVKFDSIHLPVLSRSCEEAFT